MFSSLGSHVDFLEYISMVVFYRFIYNLEVAIWDREKYSSNLGKSLRGGGVVESFWTRINIRGIPSRLSEYIPEQAALKGLS